MLRSDSVLAKDIAQEFAADVQCSEAKISFDVHNGVVTLSGRVADPTLRAAAVRAVKRVYGVEGVDPQTDVEAAAATV